MFNDHDQKTEHDLELLKNSITPAADLVHRISMVTPSDSPRYPWYHMIQKKFIVMIPAAAALVVAIVLIGGRNQGQQGISSDDIINRLVNDAQDEQLIANESDADVVLVDSDRAALDSFAGSYNANEY